MAGADLVVPLIGAQLALVAWFMPFTAQAVTVLPGLAALWVLRTAPGEKRTTQPMRGYVGRAVRSVGEAGFPSVLMLAFLRFFGRFALLTYLPLQLTRELGASLSEVGVVMSVVGGLGFVSATLAGRVSAHVRPSVIVLVSLLSVAGAMFGFASLPSMTFALAVAVVYALGDGFIGVMQSSFAARGAPANVRAGLVAVNGTARNAGKLVSPLLIGTVAAVSTVGVGLAITAAVMLAGIAVVPGLRRLDHALRQDDSDRSGDVGDPVERASQ